MALLKYLKITLSTAKETGISKKAMKEANAAVSQLTSPQRQLFLKLRIYYTAFRDERRSRAASC